MLTCWSAEVVRFLSLPGLNTEQLVWEVQRTMGHCYWILGECTGFSPVLIISWLSITTHVSVLRRMDNGSIRGSSPHWKTRSKIRKQENPARMRNDNPQTNRCAFLYIHVCWRRHDGYTATNQGWQTTKRVPGSP
jgi:hypothetical protein